MISNLPAECTRLEKLLHSVSSRTSPAATLNNARTPVSLHSSSIPPLSPDSVLNTIQHLLRQFENCEQAPVSRGWSNELRRAVETIARVTQELSHGRQTPPFPSAFRPLVHTIFWPDHWLFPLSKLHALLTRPLNGTAAATPASTPTPPPPTPPTTIAAPTPTPTTTTTALGVPQGRAHRAGDEPEHGAVRVAVPCPLIVEHGQRYLTALSVSSHCLSVCVSTAFLAFQGPHTVFPKERQ